MPERDPRRYLPLAKHNSVDRTTLNWLVDRKRLPKDIEVKAMLEGKRRGDDHRSENFQTILNEAVLAALDGKPLPDFLRAPYPNAFPLVVAANWKGRLPLDMLPEDFHTLSSLRREADKLSVNGMVMYTLWHRLITEVEPQLGLKIGRESHRSRNWYHQLSYAIVKDQPAYEAYRSESVQKRLRVGIGAVAVKPLGYLLADNHPEMYRELGN